MNSLDDKVKTLLDVEIACLIKTARQVFESPSKDSRRPQGIYLKGKRGTNELIKRIKEDPYLRDIILSLDPPSEREASSWYIIEVEHFLGEYFPEPTHQPID